MPFVIVIPLFFKVNYRGKLYQLERERKEGKGEIEEGRKKE